MMTVPVGEIVQGDMLEVLAGWPAGCLDAVVCDPPYGLHFMGQAWDAFKGNLGKRIIGHAGEMGAAADAGAYDSRRNAEYGRMVQRWARALFRVMKPGAHLVMFGAPRRSHWEGVALELAGFEVRDTLCWLFGEGFPKSYNVGKRTGEERWDGWGTALKPGWEPIILARKPLAGTVADTVQTHGTGALNIDGCRLETMSEEPASASAKRRELLPGLRGHEYRSQHRWPANVALDEEAAAMLDENAGAHPGASSNSRGDPTPSPSPLAGRGGNGALFDPGAHGPRPGPGDSGGASRFFYCAKARRGEREAGLEPHPPTPSPSNGEGERMRNDHPTVKPLALMRWLVRLVTPPGGVVLDPFAGSGSTVCAAALEGVDAVGIEMSERYCAIARARLAYWREVAAAGGDEADLERQRAHEAVGQMDLLAQEGAE